jgi:ribonucleoside-diphosphate reductase alpha chain
MTHAQKYRNPDESFPDAMMRIANGLADDPVHLDNLYDVLLDMRFMPAGRIQAAIGSKKTVTPFNCYVSSEFNDSFVEGERSIMDISTRAATTMRQGGGIGYNFSPLRPRGALIKKLMSESSGPVSFMHILDAICLATSSAGNRRGAQMGVLNVNHPDIEEFIDAKKPPASSKIIERQLEHARGVLEMMVNSGFAKDDPDFIAAKNDFWDLFMAMQATLKLQGFNVSVGIFDDFMKALEADQEYSLVHGGTTYRQISAPTLWEKIMRSTWDWAEPGVLFLDTINRENNLWYCENITATNPCVPAGTPILTDQGWLPIETLVDQQVQVWNGTEWSSVEPMVTGTDQPLVTVRLSNGKHLTCTKAHRFVLADGTRKEAVALEEGDILQTCPWPVVFGGQEHDEKYAYTQGFFAGDGWLAGNNRPYISFKQDDKKSLEKHFVFENAYTTSYNYRFIYLKNNVIPDKSFVPDCSWSVKSRLVWLAGYLDADGTVAWSYNDKRERSSCAIQFGSTNKEFAEKLAMMLQTLGVDTTIGTDERDGRNIYYGLQIRASQVNALIQLGLKTHRLDMTGNNPQRTATRHLRVESISDAGVADTVFCFTEPLKHQGCFNGVLTGQCGEQPLPPNGACLLGSFNIVKYVETDENGRRSINLARLARDIPTVVRAMDNVIDNALFPLPEQKEEAIAKRRMGLGVTGVANAIEALGPGYGTPEFLEIMREILSLIAEKCYEASIDLAIEKGPFPALNRELFVESGFCRRVLPNSTLARIRKHGIRNSHLLSIAPTGTISLCADNISSGIEPVFSYKQKRLINFLGGQQQVDLLDYGYANFGVLGRKADDIKADEHLAVLIEASKWVDSAVSKTCNVSPDMAWEDFKSIYFKAWKNGCKGITTFNKGGKRAGILMDMDEGLTCSIDPKTGRRSCE